MDNSKTKDFIIFYSWQADLPDETNRRLIRETLRMASSRLEEEFSNAALHIILDEATRGRAGSPNIPFTILDKIKNSDAFVCDITTINKSAPVGQRRVPNPNVIFELGYAVAYLGWDRIVMLFNTFHGAFPDDAPFDIDRQRASLYDFNLPETTGKKLTNKQLMTRKEPLVDLLFTALKEIVEQDPTKPIDQRILAPGERRRKSDITTLRLLLSSIHIPTLDRHLEEAPYKVYDSIFRHGSS
jgi:hypothetical protein